MMLDHFTTKATGHYTMLVSSGIRTSRHPDCRLVILPRVNLRAPSQGAAPIGTPRILNLEGDEAGRVSVNCQWIDIALYATSEPLAGQGNLRPRYSRAEA
jgi:hypothetical protein